MTARRFPRRRQAGAVNMLVATLLIALITLGTLSVSRTQLQETRMENSAYWSDRLLTVAESALQTHAANLPGMWKTLGLHGPVRAPQTTSRQLPVVSPAADIEVRTTLQHSRQSPQLVQLQSNAQRLDGGGLASRVHQGIRLFSVLTPLAEQAPPLVLNGCLSSLSTVTHLRPRNSDTAGAGDALWQYRGSPCTATAALDLHAGRVRHRRTANGLWPEIFSISKQEFADLAARGSRAPLKSRHYWQAAPGDLPAGRWTLSLGTPQNPVVLYFPATVGCPRFAAGVRIVGLVFIEADCQQPLGDARLVVFGSLVVDGHLNVGPAQLSASHISLAEPTLHQLPLPVLRYIPIPGSWRDF